MLDDLSTQKKWNAITFNNYLALLRSIFNWFVREEIIDKNPVRRIEKRKSIATSHRYYDDPIAAKLKDIIRRGNPYLLSFCEFIYHTGTRPKSEARLLQVKHLLFVRELISISGSISKNKNDDYIPMAPELKETLLYMRSLYPESFIWGLGDPASKPVSQNYFAALYKPYKGAVRLDDQQSIYGWKHTRIIDLANATVDPYAIMKLYRHSSLEITIKYLRELGCEVDWKKYNIEKKF